MVSSKLCGFGDILGKDMFLQHGLWEESVAQRYVDWLHV